MNFNSDRGLLSEVNKRGKMSLVQECNVNCRYRPSGLHLCRNVVIVQCCNSVMPFTILSVFSG
jgi:hypothetical protein